MGYQTHGLGAGNRIDPLCWIKEWKSRWFVLPCIKRWCCYRSVHCMYVILDKKKVNAKLDKRMKTMSITQALDPNFPLHCRHP